MSNNTRFQGRRTVLAAAVLMLFGQVAMGASTDARQEAIDRALANIQNHPGVFKLPTKSLSSSAKMLSIAPAKAGAATRTLRTANNAVGDQFSVRDVVIDHDGTEHVRFDRFYGGLPVIGGDIVTTTSSSAQFRGATLAALRTTARPKLVPKITVDQATLEAGVNFPGTVSKVVNEGLVIYARDGKPTLAYAIHINGERNDGVPVGDVTFYIDAAKGVMLGLDDHVFMIESNGTGKSLTAGNVSITTNSANGAYQLVDPSRGNGTTYDAQNTAVNANTGDFDHSVAKVFTDSDNVWGNNATSDRATVGVDVHYGVAATWDYFKNVHGRTGIFNDGKGVTSYAHVGKNYVNAFWLDTLKTMNYGDGNASLGYLPVVALDVAGHEMSHGVNTATANLGYYYVKDSGGLNESNSDILGTLVEFSTNNPASPGNYVIGENIIANNPDKTKGFRLMFKQEVDGSSYSCYPAGGFTSSQTYPGGPYDPHNTSGVGNRFFYLLAEGAVVPAGFQNKYSASDLVCNGNTNIVGIGREKAGKIWYRALTTGFTSTTTYPQAREATLQAAADLYGANSTEWKAVATAWSAANVGTGSYPPGDGGDVGTPAADFSAAVNGLTVNFTNSSTDTGGTITAYAWNFGDGSTSTTTNPSHTYLTAGTYTVTLKVTDNTGETDTKTQSVTVSDDSTPPVGVPVANFTSTVNGLTASFTNSSTDTGGTITAYAWSFGDGATSTLANPSHTYLAAGTYPVTLKVTDNTGASNTKTQSVKVTNPGDNGGGNVFSNNTPTAIGSNAAIISTITVSGKPGNGPALLKVSANITHSMTGDLQIRITAPNGSSLVLKNPDFFTSNGTINTTWLVNASQVQGNGTWKLTVIDYDLFGRGDHGTLNNWKLTF